MSSDRFEARVAVVTGAASGIGLAIARRLVKEGARVVAGDINEAALHELQTELGEGRVAIALVDVRIESQVQAMTQMALDRFGALHLGFNCAGLGAAANLVDLAEADWDRVIDVCLKGCFLSVKHQARAMSDGGAIVNIASLNSHVPMHGGVAYTCAKAGVEMLSRNAALELASRRIRVNTVSPGLTDTPLTAAVHAIPGLEAAFMERIPLGRWGTPQDMAAAALFLASDDAGYISGANLFVDGAWETTGYPDRRPFVAALDGMRRPPAS